MEISSSNLPHSRLQYTVQLSGLEVAEFFSEAVEELKSTIKIPGFRPGKAPLELVKDQLDQEAVREKAYSLAVRSAWQQIVGQLTQLPIEDPAVELEKFEEGESAKLVFSFDFRPEISVTSWQKITIRPQKVKEVTEEEVEKVITSLLTHQATEVISLAPAEIGNKIQINFSGSIDGQKLDKLSGQKFPLILGQEATIPGFSEQLVGLKKGEQKTFPLDFPKEHFDPQLAGQKVTFEVKVEEVFQLALPKLDNELAKQFGAKSPEELKERIRDDLAKQKTDEALQDQKAEWLKQFAKLIKTDLPESLIRAEADRSRQAWQEFLSSRNLKTEDWLKARQTTMAELEKSWQAQANESAKISLGLVKVAEERKVELKSNDDFQQLLNKLVAEAIK